MLKRWTALLLAVMLIFLTACGAQKEYKLSAVFAAAEEDRTQWLADPDNAALWEQLGLSGSVVSDGDPAALTIGAQHWVLQPATVEGRSVTLCYCVDEQNRPLLDLRASFGINVLPVEEWTACEDLFIVRVWAQQGGKLPENYLSGEDEGLNRYAVLLTDPITGESASAVASDAELQALLADGEPHALCLRLRAMQQGEPSLRVVTVLCQGWLEKESVLRVQSEQLLWAARHGENDTLRLLLNEGNVSVTDRNGDGLLWAALQSGNAETVELVVKAGATGEPQSLLGGARRLDHSGAPGLAAAAFHPGGAAHRYRLHGAFHCLLLHRHGECRTAVALPGPFPALGGGGRPSRRGQHHCGPALRGGKRPNRQFAGPGCGQ